MSTVVLRNCANYPVLGKPAFVSDFLFGSFLGRFAAAGVFSLLQVSCCKCYKCRQRLSRAPKAIAVGHASINKSSLSIEDGLKSNQQAINKKQSL